MAVTVLHNHVEIIADAVGESSYSHPLFAVVCQIGKVLVANTQRSHESGPFQPAVYISEGAIKPGAFGASVVVVFIDFPDVIKAEVFDDLGFEINKMDRVGVKVEGNRPNEIGQYIIHVFL